MGRREGRFGAYPEEPPAAAVTDPAPWRRSGSGAFGSSPPEVHSLSHTGVEASPSNPARQPPDGHEVAAGRDRSYQLVKQCLDRGNLASGAARAYSRSEPAHTRPELLAGAGLFCDGCDGEHAVFATSSLYDDAGLRGELRWRDLVPLAAPPIMDPRLRPAGVESFLSSFSTLKIGSQGVDRVAIHGISREGLNRPGFAGGPVLPWLSRRLGHADGVSFSHGSNTSEAPRSLSSTLLDAGVVPLGPLTWGRKVGNLAFSKLPWTLSTVPSNPSAAYCPAAPVACAFDGG